MTTDRGTASLLQRALGLADNGVVTIEDFDRGVVETLGAVPLRIPGPRSAERYAYYWQLPSVRPPPGMPGVPVIFATSEDTFERYKVPYVKVAAGGLQPAMNRWHPGTVQFRAAAPTSRPAALGGAVGPDRTIQRQQAHPFDLPYTITVATKRRAMPNGPAGAARPAVPFVEGGSSGMLLTEVLRVYPAYCGVNVRDSVGDYRTYSAVGEGPTPIDEVNEVGDRIVGYSISLRVEGELDLDPAEIRPTVIRALTVRGASR